MKSRKRTHIVRPFQLVEKVRFLFCASCDSTHKIEFAQQIHKNRGRVPRFLYKGRKNVSGGRGFSSAFDRKRGFDREAARKTIVFRQPQREATKPLFFHLFCSFLCRLFSQIANSRLIYAGTSLSGIPSATESSLLSSSSARLR
mgnify:CR=1 FL=1